MNKIDILHTNTILSHNDKLQTGQLQFYGLDRHGTLQSSVQLINSCVTQYLGFFLTQKHSVVYVFDAVLQLLHQVLLTTAITKCFYFPTVQISASYLLLVHCNGADTQHMMSQKQS